MIHSGLEYNCIFGGGAIRGMAYIGALKALEEFKVKLNILVGSSVGAIFAGLLAVGYNYKEIEDIFMKVNFELFKDIQIGKSFGISKGEIFLEWIQELLERKYYGESYIKGKNAPIKFSDLKKNLVIITTNLANFGCKEFSTFKTPDVEVAYAIRISAAMPGLMPPVKASGAVLVDGDLQKSWPLWKLVPDLCKPKERILEFRLEGDFDIDKQGNIDFVNTVYSCVTSVATKFIVDKYAQRDKFDYLIINTGSTIIVDFNMDDEKRQNLIKMGYEQTKKYFYNDLKIKKKKLIEYYLPLYNFIDNLLLLAKKNKYKDVKLLFGDFYLKYIQEISKYIERDYLNEINKIRDFFLDNYSLSFLLKQPVLKHSKVLIHRMENLQKDVKQRLEELQAYSAS